MELGIEFILKNQTSVMPKAMFGICDFRSNRDEPIGTLVDKLDTDHANPQFILMIDWGFFYYFLC